MDFRYHPIIEGLKVNEDGTEILLNGNRLNIYHQKHGLTKKGRKVVQLNQKTVTTTRLTLEAWIGVKPTGEMTARRVEEDGGDHYSNLYWGKTGSTKSNQKNNPAIAAKRIMTREVFDDIEKRKSNESVKDICAEYGCHSTNYYKSPFYVKKNK